MDEETSADTDFFEHNVTVQYIYFFHSVQFKQMNMYSDSALGVVLPLVHPGLQGMRGQMVLICFQE